MARRSQGPRIARKPRIIKRVVLDEEGRLVCPKCRGRNYRVDDYSADGNGMIHFVYTCSCGARFAADKHIRFVGSPYLDRWPEAGPAQIQTTHMPESPKKRRGRRKA